MVEDTVAILPQFSDSLNAAVAAAQLATMREYHDALLAVVYWALGAMVGVSLLLIGFGWFANFKVYERDKVALKQELSGEITAELAQVRESFAKARDDLRGAAASAAQNAVSELRSQLDRLEVGLLKHEIGLAESREQYGQVVSRAIDWLRYAILHQSSHDIDDAMEKLLRATQKGGSYIASELREVTALLDKVPPAHAVLKERLVAALRDAHII